MAKFTLSELTFFQLLLKYPLGFFGKKILIEFMFLNFCPCQNFQKYFIPVINFSLFFVGLLRIYCAKTMKLPFIIALDYLIRLATKKYLIEMIQNIIINLTRLKKRLYVSKNNISNGW